MTSSKVEYCDMCDGTGLMEGWNRRDGFSCPKCKGRAVMPICELCEAGEIPVTNGKHVLDIGHGYKRTFKCKDNVMVKNPNAVSLGRLGGKASKGKTSEAKAKASRENGKKGGRPKKSG